MDWIYSGAFVGHLDCRWVPLYDSANTSSMAMHVKQQHPCVLLTGVKTKAAQQPLITVAFTVMFICLVFFLFFFLLLIRKMIRSVILIYETIRTVSFLIRCTPTLFPCSLTLPLHDPFWYCLPVWADHLCTERFLIKHLL